MVCKRFQELVASRGRDDALEEAAAEAFMPVNKATKLLQGAGLLEKRKLRALPRQGSNIGAKYLLLWIGREAWQAKARQPRPNRKAPPCGRKAAS